MAKLGKAKWHREYEREHYLYILAVTCHKVRIELAGAEWAYGNRDGGWNVAEIGNTVPLEDGWGSVDGKVYETATEAKTAAEELLRKVVKRI